jgi:hypothetical protein
VRVSPFSNGVGGFVASCLDDAGANYSALL